MDEDDWLELHGNSLATTASAQILYTSIEAASKIPVPLLLKCQICPMIKRFSRN